MAGASSDRVDLEALELNIDKVLKKQKTYHDFTESRLYSLHSALEAAQIAIRGTTFVSRGSKNVLGGDGC